MKDAFGHGSNGLTGALRARLNHVTILKPVTSNAEAANSLMSALKSTQAPTHDAMAGRMADPTSVATNSSGNAWGSKETTSGGQRAVNQLRGGGRDWSGSPIAMKGLHK